MIIQIIYLVHNIVTVYLLCFIMLLVGDIVTETYNKCILILCNVCRFLSALIQTTTVTPPPPPNDTGV